MVIDASSDVGWKNFCTLPVGEEGVGTGIRGITMIGDFGGPCPFPSCATARVVTADVMTKRVTIVYLILNFSSGAAVHGAGEVSTPSVGNIAVCRFREKRRIRDLSRGTVDSHVLCDERSIVC